jgi:hypothetical protein
LATTPMKASATYSGAGWDFSTGPVWTFNGQAGSIYPVLVGVGGQ